MSQGLGVGGRSPRIPGSGRVTERVKQRGKETHESQIMADGGGMCGSSCTAAHSGVWGQWEDGHQDGEGSWFQGLKSFRMHQSPGSGRRIPE